MTYTMHDIITELDTRFEPEVRAGFDACAGRVSVPFVVLMGQHNPKEGKRFDCPTPMPVVFGGTASAAVMRNAVRQNAVLVDAVAAFVAYPCDSGVKMRVETSTVSREWLIPVIAQKGGPPYLGKRIDYAVGEYEVAKAIDDIDPFGGIIQKQRSRTIIEA